MRFRNSYASLALVILALSALLSVKLMANEFAGSKSCSNCHQQQAEAWQGSHHDLAMQQATTESVLGDFNQQSFSANGITTTFFKKDDEFWVNTDGPDGNMADFKIGYTFGFTPLQQYLVKFPDGRMQALGIAWDARPKQDGGQRWFHLYPDPSIVAGDDLHWTGQQQNWNYMCADCHSTNLNKGYNATTNTFKTTWSEINVGCESCHGPAQQHLDWAAKDDELRAGDARMGLNYLLQDRKDISWQANPETGTAKRSHAAASNTEIDVCATCHSRRGQFKTGVESDGKFLDYYRPALLTAELYHTDGQVKDENYVWGSFVQSKMYSAGVTCSDCHEPHSLELRAPQQQVCSQCHLPAKYASREHHQHPQDSTGANCLECHMPETTYMLVDPRRDHSLRIPRPDVSLEFGTPNACNQCHVDKNVQWAAKEFTKMWPDAVNPYQDWTKAFALARSGAPQSEIVLIKIIRDKDKPAIARATAIAEIRPYLSPLSGKVLQIALTDESPLVRFAALGVLDALPAENRYQFAAPLLQDPVRLVRIEAARISAAAMRSQLEPEQRIILQSALAELIAAGTENADRPESYLNLGNMHTQTGDAGAAEKSYRQAINLNAKFSPAYANLADLYRMQGMEKHAQQVLQDGIDTLPGNAMLYHSLGLMQARNQQLDQALVSLKTAADLQPETSRYTYVYGVALNSTGDSDGAMKVLKGGHTTHPRDQEIIFMIASIERDQGNRDKARVWVQKLLDINPTDQNAAKFMGTLDSPSK